jgi:ESS family glutamate:Na+ symporter
MQIEIDGFQMLAISISVLFMGMYLTRKVKFLERNYIPPAVTGGLLFSTFTWVLHSAAIDFDFDLNVRDIFLLVFFSTVGFSAKFRVLRNGGKSLIVLIVLAGAFLVMQNAIGVAVASWYGVPPGLGLMAGSVSLAGGHGTATAWGTEAAAAGLEGALEVGLLFATFGLIAGGLLGGPIARFLIERNGLAPAVRQEKQNTDLISSIKQRAYLLDDDPLFPVLRILFMLAICVSLGAAVNLWLAAASVRLPGFLTAMFVAIALTNLADLMRRPFSQQLVDGFGAVSLNIFLAMSMMTLQLWVLNDSFLQVMGLLILQILFMAVYATQVVFRFTGQDYDAAVMTAGFTGLGLGATPVALANMDSVSRHYGYSAKAFIVIPIIGAFFIDILNAGVINFFLSFLEGFSP